MFLTGGITFLDNVKLVNNVALGGGAVYVGLGAQLTVNNADFSFNEATGAAFAQDANGELLVSLEALFVRKYANKCD